jgi:lysophospholipase L1-like esterase
MLRIIVLIVALALTIVFFDVRRVRHRIAWGVRQAVETASYVQAPEKATARMVVVGDSTAYGVGAETPKESVAGYFGATYPDLSIENLSVSGARLEDAIKQLESVKGSRADIVLMMVGGNDIIRFTSLPDVKARLETLLGIAGTISDQVVVLHSGNIGLAPFFPRWAGWLWSHRSRAVRAIYLDQIARHDAAYVDLYTNRRGDPFFGELARFYAPDGLHLSGDGYRVWFDSIQRTMMDQGLTL